MNFKHLALWLLIVLLVPQSVFAGEYLVGIPNIDSSNLTLNAYINALYAMSISIAALLAVIKIIIAGVRWMLADIVTSKQEAKSDIEGALLGLLIIMAAVLILTTINPALTNTNVLQSITPVQPAPASATPPPPTQAERAAEVLGPLASRVQPAAGGGSIIESTMQFESPPEVPPDPVTGEPQPQAAHDALLSPEQRAQLQAEEQDMRLRMTQACAIVGGQVQGPYTVGASTNTRRAVTCSRPIPQ